MIGYAAVMNAQTAQQQLQLSREQFAWTREEAGRQLEFARERFQSEKVLAEKQFDLSDRALASATRFAEGQLDLGRDALAQSKSYADAQIQLGKDYLGFMQSQAEITNQWAQEDRDRRKMFEAREDEFMAEADAYDSPERRAMEADQAAADVRQQFDLGRDQNERQLTAMGVNPNSGRYQSSSNRLQATENLGVVGARNAARRQTADTARQMKVAAINMGQGLSVNPATSMGLSNQAGSAGFSGAGSLLSSGVNTGMAGYNTAGNLMSSAASTSSAGFGTSGTLLNSGVATSVGANQGYANSMVNAADLVGSGYNAVNSGYDAVRDSYSDMATILNDQYRSRLSAWEAQQSANANLASGLGTAAGYLAFGSSKNIKENKSKPMSVLNAVRDMPVEEWEYKEGHGDGQRHIGPYAEDFQKATGLGDGKKISVIDALGVTMGAVQELADKVDKVSAGAKPKRKQMA
ncbi:Hep_Hag [Roseobacter sp. AzwK-3b]|nr:Hep_Hag [Roseobacter sp. AzwK-3b]